MMLYGPVRKLSNTSNQIQQSVPAAERVFELLDLEQTVVDRPQARPLEVLRETIAFEHVSFQYEDGAGPVLHDICLVVNTGRDGGLCRAERRREIDLGGLDPALS